MAARERLQVHHKRIYWEYKQARADFCALDGEVD
jgi:hypothetical protein